MMNIKRTDLELRGCDYAFHRIPGMVCTKKGTLLAYCESRSGGDWSVIDITLRKSTDNGETWSDRRVIVESDGRTTNNPVMFADTENDIVHFIWFKDYRECYYKKSYDEGETWTEPVDITYVFDSFKGEFNWSAIAAGPGHGIRLKNGRLFTAVWLAETEKHVPSVVSGIFSDDNGATWKRGAVIYPKENMKDPNETASVELSDGRVMLNIRNHSDMFRRLVAVSSDGGETFSEPVFDMQLRDPRNAAGFERYIDKNGEYTFYFVNCDNDTGPRENLTLRSSRDDCKTWKTEAVLEKISGYSDLCINPLTKTMFCYYEQGWYEGKVYQPEKLVMAKIEGLI